MPFHVGVTCKAAIELQAVAAGSRPSLLALHLSALVLGTVNEDATVQRFGAVHRVAQLGNAAADEPQEKLGRADALAQRISNDKSTLVRKGLSSLAMYMMLVWRVVAC